MDNTFANKLNALKQTRKFSVQELALKAGVSGGLISGLIHGYRIIGEKTARRIAGALNLQGEELERFIHSALNNGCTERVLNSSKGFPSEILNLVAGELNGLGIAPEIIESCEHQPKYDIALKLTDGRTAMIHLEIACN